MTTTPLDIAVQQIIANSHLTNDEYSYYHIGALSSLNPNTVSFPIVTSVTNTYSFNSTKAYTELRVSIIFEKPNIEVCENRLIYQNQLINYAQLYAVDIVEIAYWLSGKYKLNGKKLIEDVYLSDRADSTINYYFGGTLKDDEGNLLLSDNIVIVEGVLRLEGYPADICKPIFNPDPVC